MNVQRTLEWMRSNKTSHAHWNLPCWTVFSLFGIVIKTYAMKEMMSKITWHITVYLLIYITDIILSILKTDSSYYLLVKNPRIWSLNIVLDESLYQHLSRVLMYHSLVTLLTPNPLMYKDVTLWQCLSECLHIVSILKGLSEGTINMSHLYSYP